MGLKLNITGRKFTLLHHKKVTIVAAVLAVWLVCQLVSVTWSSNQALLSSTLKRTELEEHQNFKHIGVGVDKLPKDATLREQLSYHFPYNPSKPISNKIWQTWKCDVSDPKFPKHFRVFSSTWAEKNPEYNHLVIPDSVSEELILHLYQQVPQVLNLYRMLPKNILKLDFFRYLILYARGGTYSDIDTLNLKPVDTWLSFNKTINGVTNNLGLVVGIELDPDRPDWADWYSRRIQFCQWTIQLKLGHPLLRELIVAITNETLRKEKAGFLHKVEGKDEGGDIMNWTGPGIFTDIVFKYLNNVQTNGKAEGVIDWKYFTGMQEPILADDVLVLPITSFSPGVGQMGAQTERHPLLYVKHMFQGSWKPEKERHIGE